MNIVPIVECLHCERVRIHNFFKNPYNFHLKLFVQKLSKLYSLLNIPTHPLVSLLATSHGQASTAAHPFKSLKTKKALLPTYCLSLDTIDICQQTQLLGNNEESIIGVKKTKRDIELAPLPMFCPSRDRPFTNHGGGGGQSFSVFL